jgi:DNA-directed RNA polymerase subunit RPC12/RpoP
VINKISKGDKIKCLGCGKTIELTSQTFTLDSYAEYIVCPICGLKFDVQAYHLYGEKGGAEE